jgi:hypothetical protein
MKYRVTIIEVITHSIDVEAQDQEFAKDRAWHKFQHNRFLFTSEHAAKDFVIEEIE